mmetsp:Transcript_31397/g.66074  ORF Transcript_31397/g.66074 Transcript_31397/m.66074 type:complete len:1093 (-) Transcript_31397:1416-4694(-)
MASLQVPLTIISSGGSEQPFHPPAATWFDEEALHFVALEARPRPLSSYATRRGSANSDYSRGGKEEDWFRGSMVSRVGSIDSSALVPSITGGANKGSGQDDGGDEQDVDKEEEHPSEIVRYQVFALPKHHQHNQLQNSSQKLDDDNDKDDDCGSVVTSFSRQPIVSVFDAAKKAAQDAAQDNLQALTIEIDVKFPLPLQLATIDNSGTNSPSILSEENEDDTTYTSCATEAISRKVPILAKFSPKMKNGMRFLAMQYTPTMVRVALVEEEDHKEEAAAATHMRSRRRSSASSVAEISKTEDVHWTIDLSYDAYPVASKPERLANFQEGSVRNLFGSKAPKLEEGIVPGTTTIIGGGVLWCARQGRGQQQQDENTFLDLIIVTTTSVIIYNMSIAKRQLVKTQVLPHELASSFWYEPLTLTLVIGSYKSTRQNSNGGGDELGFGASLMSFSSSYEPEHRIQEDSSDNKFPSAVMSMKTLFFSKKSPSVETLPTFSVGTLREVVANEVEEQHLLHLSLESFDIATLENEEDPESAVVLPTEIFLVNLYGSVYCVELGSLGLGRGGIGLTKLDREAGCIHVRHQKFETLKGHKVDVESTISVGVIDNLLCIFSQKEETAHFLDVAASFSDDQRVFRKCIEVFDSAKDNASGGAHINDEALSFLAPSYFLDTDGQGLLYEAVLSLPLILENVPPAACIIPFLQRRNVPRATFRTHIMERFSQLIGKRDLSSLRKWMAVIVEQYSESEVALKFDFESTVTLLSKSSLTSMDDIVHADGMTHVDHIMVPASCDQVLTQTEILQMILLPHAMSAIKKGDFRKLKFISSLSVHYFVELEKRFMPPSVALHCLVVALLWRTGENAELSSFLSAQQSQWTISRRRRQMNLPSANRMFYENPGAIPFGETIFLIATEEVLDRASTPCSPSTRRQLISYATIILVGCGATSLAVNCLLVAGQLNDAINLCSKRMKSTGESKDAERTQSKDFFRAAVSNARKLSSVSERCQSFYHLYCFLQQWDPSIFELDSRKIRIVARRGSVDQGRRRSFERTIADDPFETMAVEQSVLAHECPRFPDDLFGGKESAYSKKLRLMFGYVHTVK